MKQIFITLLALLLVLCSCSQRSDLPSAESQDSNSDTIEQTESLMTSVGCIEFTVPDYASFDINEKQYQEMFASKFYNTLYDSVFPKKYVEAISFCDIYSQQFDYGEYEESVTEFVRYTCYECRPLGDSYSRYRLDFKLVYKDGYSQNGSLTVLHGDLSEPSLTEEVKKDAIERGALPAIYFREDHLVVTDHEGDDLRYYSGGSETVDYFCNGIRYTYEMGNLTEIHWQSGDIKFWLAFDEPLYAPNDDGNNQGALKHKLLVHFLNKDLTDKAVAEWDEVITFINSSRKKPIVPGGN